MNEIECKKCGELCVIEGEYPKFHAWCDTCGDYAKGFDCLDHAADWMGSKIDEVYDRMKDEDINSK